MKKFFQTSVLVLASVAMVAGNQSAFASHGGFGGGPMRSGGAHSSPSFKAKNGNPGTFKTMSSKSKLASINTGNVKTGSVMTGKGTVGSINTGNVKTGSVKTGSGKTGNVNTGNVTTGSVKTGSGKVGNINTGNVTTGSVSTGKGQTGNVNTGGVTTGSVTTGSGSVGNINTGGVTTGSVGTGSGKSGNTNTGGVTTGNVNTGSGSVGNINTGNINSGNVINETINKNGGGFGGLGLLGGGLLGGFGGGGGGGYDAGGYVDATPAPAPAPAADPAPAPTALPDLQPIDVKQIDGGDPQENLGPRYRVTVLNDSTVNVNQEFTVALLASGESQLASGLPGGIKRVNGLNAGETTTVDIRLPQGVSFNYLGIVVDGKSEVRDARRDNNSAVMAKEAVPMLAQLTAN